MKPSLLLRTTSVASFLFAGGHTLGGMKSWSPIGENDVLRAMRSFHFDVEGVSRTYLDFYLGFGFVLSVYLLLQAVLLWQLAKIADADPRRTRPLIASFSLASVASGFLSWAFIFPVPVIFNAAIAACLAITFYSSGGSKGVPAEG
jgi:hypothetical protein